MTKALRVAVLGAGYWGQKLVREYLALSAHRSDVVLAVVADPSPAALEAVRAEHGDAVATTTDVQAVLVRDDIDAVHVAVPNEHHATVAGAALRAHKHVLLEKPLTLDTHEAYELVEVASRSSRVFAVGHIFQFNNAIELARRMVRHGDLGRIWSVRLRWSSRLEPLPDRDILFDLIPHPVDIATNILGEWPYKVTARGNSFVRGIPGMEEEATAVLEFPDGKAATIDVSWISPGEKVREVYIRGSSATLRIDALNQKVQCYPNNQGEAEDIPVEANNTIHDEIAHFVDCIQAAGQTEYVNGAYIGAKTVEVIEALRLSLTEERTIYIDDVRRRAVRPQPEAKRYTAFAKVFESSIGRGAKVYDFANLYRCSIGDGVKVDSYVYIEEGVTIGDRTKIRAGAFIPSGVSIGNDVFIGPGVIFTNDKHPRASGEWTQESIVVHDGASIGAGAIILPGVTIGERSMVAAGAVVTKDVEPETVVAGNPARVRGAAPEKIAFTNRLAE